MIGLYAALLIAANAPPTEPTIPPATLDPTLEVTGEDLAARELRSRLFVQVRINGEGPYRFLVDSGADRSVVGRRLARTLRLPPAGIANLQSIAGASQVDTVRVDRLTLGSSTIEDIIAPTLAEADLGADGLIGIDALADQRLKLDFDARTITVQDTRQPVVDDPDEIVVTARRRKGQLILTQATASGVGIYAVIDSGAEISIGNSRLRAAILRGRRPPVLQQITITSVTGQTVVAEVAMLPRITMGGLTLGNVMVAFADIPPFALFGLSRQPALLLGTDLLQVFRQVSLDFRRRKVRFKLRR